MRKLFYLLAVVILATSCNKDNNGPELQPEKTYPVSFITSLNFNAVDTKGGSDSISGGSDSISTDSVYYQYRVYSSTGAKIKSIDGDGYQIKDNLSPGTYYISIIAYHQKHASVGVASNYHTDLIGGDKTFYQTFSHTVGTDSTANSKNVSLEKMWGEIEVEILDRATCYLPANISSIRFSMKGRSDKYEAKTKDGRFGTGFSITSFSTNDFRSKNLTNNPSYSTGSNKAVVSLEFSFTDGTPTKTVHLSDVAVKKGTRTILKGNLGDALKGSSNEQGFSLALDNSWRSEIISF